MVQYRPKCFVLFPIHMHLKSTSKRSPLHSSSNLVLLSNSYWLETGAQMIMGYLTWSWYRLCCWSLCFPSRSSFLLKDRRGNINSWPPGQGRGFLKWTLSYRRYHENKSSIKKNEDHSENIQNSLDSLSDLGRTDHHISFSRFAF